MRHVVMWNGFDLIVSVVELAGDDQALAVIMVCVAIFAGRDKR